MTYIPSLSFPSCATSCFSFFSSPVLPSYSFIYLFFAFPEDTDDSYSNSPVWGICVEKAEREGTATDKRREEKRKRSGEGGKEIRGRDCEPRRETYELFLVSSCVSHSVEGGPLVNGESNTLSVTQIDALKIVSPIEELVFKYVHQSSSYRSNMVLV